MYIQGEKYINRVQYYMLFQAPTGGLGMYPSLIRGTSVCVCTHTDIYTHVCVCMHKTQDVCLSV